MSVAGLYERIHNADSPDNPPFRNARAVAVSTVVKPIQSQLREERLEQGFRGHRLGSRLQHARGFSQNDGRSERLGREKEHALRKHVSYLFIITSEN